jgi:hypothetical protein
MKRPRICKSPRFRSSETLESFLRNEPVLKLEDNSSLDENEYDKCSICDLVASENDSIECLSCGSRIHITCAIRIKRKFGIDFFLKCLACDDIKNSNKI